MSIKDRLQMIIKMNNLSNASFADHVGVQRSSISHIMAGRNKPSLDFIQKTLQAFPRVDAQWLITGKQGVSDESLSSKEEFMDRVDNNSGNNDPESNAPSLAKKENKEIDRIVVFFTDGTFTETTPSGVTNE